MIDEMKGKGLGTLLMRHGVNLERMITTHENIQNPHWAILADEGAVGFYEKRGMTKVMPHGSGWIFSDSLTSVEERLSM